MAIVINSYVTMYTMYMYIIIYNIARSNFTFMVNTSLFFLYIVNTSLIIIARILLKCMDTHT